MIQTQIQNKIKYKQLHEINELNVQEIVPQ